MSQKYSTFVSVTKCGLLTVNPTQKHHLMGVQGFENHKDLGSWVVVEVWVEGLGNI